MIDPFSHKPPPDFDLAAALAVIARDFPDPQPRHVMANGFDNIAIITSTHVFRLPRHGQARARLVTEAAFLSLIRAHVDLPVPDLRIHDGPPVFSSHRLIPGQTLGAPEYLALDAAQRDLLARDLARLYAQLHAIPLAQAVEIGAPPVEDLPPPEEILAATLPLLSDAQQGWARAVVAAWQDLPPESDQVFSWFDGHGWNMAFDRRQGTLRGAFDFADASIGSPHWDLQHTNLIHPDLTRRMVAHYQHISGRQMDLRRIAILTGIHRLADLMDAHDHPQFGGLSRYLLDDWASMPVAHPALPSGRAT